jgi:hypothetical protein
MWSYQSAYWTENGSVTFSNSGLGYPLQTGTGAFISTVAVPDGTSSYEVKATVQQQQFGYGCVYLFLRASSDSDLNGNGTNYQGVFCGSILSISKVTNGASTTLASAGISWHNGMTIRLAINDAGDILGYVDDVFVLYAHDTSITSGSPGIGLLDYYNCGCWSLTNVQLGPADRIAPGPIGTVTVSTYSTHVDFQWPAVSDDANGTGLALYQWTRNFDWAANLDPSHVTWSDTTVQPGSEYTYILTAYDRHWNTATKTITVTTPVAPSGSPAPPDGREIGVRPTGTYWGAGNEQIDVLSGNLNFTVPLLAAEGRNGWGVGFNLTYNSQNWRSDAGGLWKLGADVGYGYGWNLFAGSLIPIYSGQTLSYYSFTDATGAQYRLNINTNGIWTSRESIYVTYDSNANRLYFRDGSFWVMGCTSASGEADAGTKYPTIL